jgi:hypothetical protein
MITNENKLSHFKSFPISRQQSVNLGLQYKSGTIHKY